MDRIIYKGRLFVPLGKFDGRFNPDLQYVELDEIIKQVHEKLMALEEIKKEQAKIQKEQQQKPIADSKIGIF